VFLSCPNLMKLHYLEQQFLHWWLVDKLTITLIIINNWLNIAADCGNSVGYYLSTESKVHGTATLLRCTLSAVVKSPSEKRLLHKYLSCSFLAESTVQDILTVPAPTRVL
jgi:hypothetical protein